MAYPATTRKLWAATAAGPLLGGVIAWGVDYYHLLSAKDLPADVHDALVLVVAAIFTFLAGYSLRPAA